MPDRSSTGAALVVLAAVAASGWGAWWHARQTPAPPEFLRRRLAFVESENGRLQSLLADQQRLSESFETGRRRKEIESAVEGLRDLRFLSPVAYREIPRGDLPAVLRAKLSQQMPDREFDRLAIGLSALGLIPPRTNLREMYLALLGEQVGAFYDQHSGELFTFNDRPLSSRQNRVILAHELTHALEDQHFHLTRLPLDLKGDEDRSLAASALVEGDATLVMNRYMLGNLDAATIRESLGATVTTDVRQLASAPRFLRESLVFPYLKGQLFCQQLYDDGGWAELARAFEHPPMATSVILHPERYRTEPGWQPEAPDLPGAQVLGAEPVDSDVLGEFGLLNWLLARTKDEARARTVAAGWNGDRYVVFGSASAASYVWSTAWRSVDAALAFGELSWALLGGDGSLMDPAGPVGASREGKPLRRRGVRGLRQFGLVVDAPARRVLIIDAQDARWLTGLRAGFDPAEGLPNASEP